MTSLTHSIDAAVRAIPPVWPLASSVAVNPYLGQSEMSLAQTGALLARVGGSPVTMGRDRYAQKIKDGDILDGDLEAALANASGGFLPSLAALKARLDKPVEAVVSVPNVADLAVKASGTDWSGLIAERFGAWAAGYFDEGQALWAAPRGHGAYAAWRDVATHDLTPEIAGLSGFAQHVADSPQSAEAMIARASDRLNLTEAAMETYFHALLMSLGGWSQVGRYKLWKAELAGDKDTTARDLLAVRLVWEEALFGLYEDAIQADWADAVSAHAQPVIPNTDQLIDGILQEAAERAGQRQLAMMFAMPSVPQKEERPAMQAAFCIDVRSEVFRRALEGVDPSIQTLGFAGFFGLATSHRSFASDVDELRLPVLLNPGVQSVSGTGHHEPRDQSARFAKRAKRAWGRFKLAAVSSFAFVEATGPIYAAKLVRDGLGLQTKPLPDDPAPRLDPALDLDAQVDAANTILRAMSLTDNFAPLVIIAGHGANVTNNAHASALHCGACGGYSGEVNARLLAGLLNDSDVREGLVAKNITIPADTHFVAALHDTTTDLVKLYAKDAPSADHKADLEKAKGWLKQAGLVCRTERALRLPRASSGKTIAARATDWAETRPEWALAGCKAFIAAPRHRTSGKGLEGKAFLHDYAWQKDDGFGILELILTAPVVVASWISLQYYGSCVAPQAFGGGNKLLHNITGGIGVVEGNGGLLRAGLPWQSVYDGEKLAHDPLRLSVCIEAPREAITDVLAKHDGVRALFDNSWLHLFRLDEAGQMAERYTDDLQWEPMSAEAGLPLLKAS